MSQNRKLKATIEATLKKVDELFDEYDVIMGKLRSADTQALKEKYEADLKKQMKKLQKQRDLMKGWLQTSDSTINPFISRIDAAKTRIDNQMYSFRDCEKETKTKAYSKEGLKLPNKQTPQEEKKEEVQNEIREEISELKKSIEDLECELKREKTKKRNVNQSMVQKYQSYITHHHWQISNLEKVLRQIDNHIIDPYTVEPVTEGVRDYLSSFKDSSYALDDEMYSAYDLSTVPDGDTDADDTDDDSASATPAPSAEKVVAPPAPSPAPPAPVSAPVPAPVLPPTPIAPVVPAAPAPAPKPITQINSVWKTKPQAKPITGVKPINYSEIIQRAVKPQTPATPATPARSIASPARPAASPAQPAAQTPAPVSPFVAAISASSPFLLATPHCCPTITTRYETVDSLVQVVQQRMPAYADIDFALPYTPDRFVAVPEGFPRFQTDIYKIGSISGMPLDVAFFAFALSQNTFTQYNAARVLRANGWHFEKKSHKWYCFTSQKMRKDAGEVCDARVFDYDSWRTSEVHDVVLAQLDFEEEVLL
ncbi:hypothetical protein WA556_002233 [Blastocystis sp. ATCC 50177/Nand II]